MARTRRGRGVDHRLAGKAPQLTDGAPFASVGGG